MANWILYVVLYLGLATVFTQFYKIATRKLTKPGALTMVLELIGTVAVLLLCPFFEMKFPGDSKVYIFLGLSIIFYAISDRVNTTVRSGIEASTFSMLKQLSTTFMTLAGLIFLKEEFVLNKFIGAMLIIFSNVLIFFRGRKRPKMEPLHCSGRFGKYFLHDCIVPGCQYFRKFQSAVLCGIDARSSSNFDCDY